MPCIVSGPVRAINGAILPGATIVVERRGVYGQEGAMVIPARRDVTVGADGILSVELYPGQYVGIVRMGRDLWEFKLSIPADESADLADCLQQMPALTPSLVQQAQASAKTAAEAAAVVSVRAKEVTDAADRISLLAQVDLVDHHDGTFTLSAPDEALISENTTIEWRGIALPAWHLTIGV